MPPPGIEEDPILPPMFAAIPTMPDMLLTVFVPIAAFDPVAIAPPFPAQGLLPTGAAALMPCTHNSKAPDCNWIAVKV
jgi:hypothetical protein